MKTLNTRALEFWKQQHVVVIQLLSEKILGDPQVPFFLGCSFKLGAMVTTCQFAMVWI